MISVSLMDHMNRGIRPAQSVPYEEDMHSPIDANSFDARPVAETKNIDAISLFGTRMRESLDRTSEDIGFLEDQHDKLKEKHDRLTQELEAVNAELHHNERVRSILHKAFNSLGDTYKGAEQAYYNAKEVQ